MKDLHLFGLYREILVTDFNHNVITMIHCNSEIMKMHILSKFNLIVLENKCIEIFNLNNFEKFYK